MTETFEGVNVRRKDDKQEWRQTDEIYELLKLDKGWARVTRNNVEALLTNAIAEGNKKLGEQLRDWR